jgi:hypothetical protein
MRKRLTVLNNGGSWEVIAGIGEQFEMFPTTWFSLSCDPLIYDGEFLAGLRCFAQPEFGEWNTGLSASCDTVITGIRDPQDSKINISPNPFSTQLIVELPNNDLWTVALYTMDGRKAKVVEFSDKRMVLSASGLRAGLYLLKIQNRQGSSFTQKVIKK